MVEIYTEQIEVLPLGKIKVAVAGVGNCCSALFQGVQHYLTPEDERALGILDVENGGIQSLRESRQANS